MSVRWITAVWEGSPYKGERLLIHLALADFANDEGICWPSQRTLAHKARCTEGFVGVALKQMMSDGHLEVERAAAGRGNPARYRLKKPPTANTLSEKPDSGTEETPFPNENTPYIGTVNKPSLLPPGFDEFWKVYPRKVAKADAAKAYAKVMKGPSAPTVEQLLEAVARYAKAQKDPQYVAHPATWLRQGRWEDEQEAPAAAPKPRDMELDNAYGAVAPMAHLGRSWEECLEMLERYDSRVVEPCKALYDQIRSSRQR
jgi:hypothetical protein